MGALELQHPWVLVLRCMEPTGLGGADAIGEFPAPSPSLGCRGWGAGLPQCSSWLPGRERGCGCWVSPVTALTLPTAGSQNGINSLKISPSGDADGNVLLLMAPGKGWEWGSSGFGSSKWMGAVRQSPGVGPLRRSALGYGFGGFPFYWNPFTLPWCLFACFYFPCRQAL